jgi:hypothetical protein
LIYQAYKAMRFSTCRNWLECARWLDSLAKWEIALTLTFTKVAATGEYRSASDVVQTTRHLIRLINRDCFGHAANRKGYRVASAYVIEYGYGGHHPHVHGTISLPPGYGYRAMYTLISQKARILHSIDRQIYFERYRDFGWFDYCLKAGTNNLIVQDIYQAKP